MKIRTVLLCCLAPVCLAASGQGVTVTAEDSALQTTFDWARAKALSYVHHGDDPVGLWYEAALPSREAFCMRDVSHQAVGAHLLGLAAHNKNMLGKFASGISESKDFCSFWEIDRLDRPAPVDFANDSAFWYNLPANMDVLQACYKLYEWTGDKDYIAAQPFAAFYDMTVNDYADRWQLQPENIMSRRRFMNKPADFSTKNGFHTCRGLPSYAESFNGIAVAIDLLASLSAANDAYAAIAAARGDTATADSARRKASAYREIIDRQWWDDANGRYNTFMKEDGSYHRGEGVPMLLWFGAAGNSERRNAAVADILSRGWNVENLSAFPMILYSEGYGDEAYRILTSLPGNERADYPEVSFAAVESIVCGVMGFGSDAASGAVSSLSRHPDKRIEARGIPVTGGFVTLRHVSPTVSEMENRTGCDLTWNVSFAGEHSHVMCAGKIYPARKMKDTHGNVISTACVPLPDGWCLAAEAL